MELVGAALGGHHNLSAGGGAKVGRHVVGVDAELLDAFRGSGHHAGAVVADVGGVVTVQVAGVVAAVQQIGVLVGGVARDIAAGDVAFRSTEGRGRGGLEKDQARNVTIDGGEVQDCRSRHGSAHRGV